MTEQGRLLLQVALNGDRDHPALPKTPEELASDGRAVVNAGAESLHLHPYNHHGQESLEADVVAKTLKAVRKACPGITISLSTSLAIESNPHKRMELISTWYEFPDMVTANMGEEGILELCDLLIEKGIGIEAGLLSLQDARIFVTSGIVSKCKRALIEPLDADPKDAVAHAEAMVKLLSESNIDIEQIHHGDGIASWAVNRQALELGHGIRTGLEDTPVLPDGKIASGNEELVFHAASLIDSIYYKRT